MRDDVGKRASMGGHRIPNGRPGSVPFFRTPLLAPVYGFVIAVALTLLLGALFAGSPDNSGPVAVNVGGTTASTTQAAATTTIAPTTTPTPAPTTSPTPAPTTAPTTAPSAAAAVAPVAPTPPLPLIIKAVAEGAPPNTFNGSAVTFSTAGKRSTTKLGADGSTAVQIAALPLDEVCLTPKTSWQVQTVNGVVPIQGGGPRTACLKGPVAPPPSGQQWAVTFTLIKAGP